MPKLLGVLFYFSKSLGLIQNEFVVQVQAPNTHKLKDQFFGAQSSFISQLLNIHIDY